MNEVQRVSVIAERESYGIQIRIVPELPKSESKELNWQCCHRVLTQNPFKPHSTVRPRL